MGAPARIVPSHNGLPPFPFPQRRKARRQVAIPPFSLAFLVNIPY